MKQKYLFKILTILFFGIIINTNAQTQGDIAFVGFNADGDDDFAIVVLNDVPANTKIWFTDSEPTGANTIESGEGKVEWDSGDSEITVGTIVIFSDFDSSASREASVGSFTDKSGTFNLAVGGDALFAYTGTSTSVTTWLAGIQNESGNEGNNLGDTGLSPGTTFIEFYSSGSPDAGFYNCSRTSESSFASYLSLLGNSSNWDSSIANGDGDTVLPFSTTSFTSSATTWNGSSNNNWSTSSNWSDGVPHGNSNVTIPDLANDPIVGATTGALANDITTNNILTVSSGGSLIVSGTSTGNITYNRALATENWYLVSSPVAGQTIVDFYTNESPAMGSGDGNDQNVAIAPYDNSQTDPNDRWDYYTEGEVDGVGSDDTTDTFTPGIGYIVKMQASGDIAFTGTMAVTDFTTLSLTDNSGGSGNSFNLMGNPYPSFIAANNNADATNNILKVNNTDNNLLSESTLWFWNQGTNSYDQINHASLAKHIAPGQGFFVSADGNSSTFSITEAMQSHQGTDSFQRLTTRPEIELTLSNGTATRNADIYYLEGTTTGWDNGYDSSIFSGVANEFAIYTHSVSNGSGRNLGIQSLPPNNYENMIIPVGINAEAGTSITIYAATNNFPTAINIYLEDKQDNSFTLLEADSNFSFTPENNLDGIGRFYLHTTSGVLSANDFATNNNISIYTSSKDNLRIAGVQKGTATVRLYNILGKEVLNTSFVGSGVNDIKVNDIPIGIYIVKLTTENGTLNRKIIIQY